MSVYETPCGICYVAHIKGAAKPYEVRVHSSSFSCSAVAGHCETLDRAKRVADNLAAYPRNARRSVGLL
jgi:hypothetical protein